MFFLLTLYVIFSCIMFCDSTVSLIEFHVFHFLLFLFFTFLFSFPSDTSKCSFSSRSRSMVNSDHTTADKQKAKMHKTGHKVFRFISEIMLKPFRKEKLEDLKYRNINWQLN